MGRRGWNQGGGAQEEARGALEVVVLAGARRPVLGLRRTPTKTEGTSSAGLLLGAEDDGCGRRCSRSSSPRALGRRGLGEEEVREHRFHPGTRRGELGARCRRRKGEAAALLSLSLRRRNEGGGDRALRGNKEEEEMD